MHILRTSSTTTRDRNLQFRGAVSTGGSPLDFCFFSSIYVQFSKMSPLKSGKSSGKSSGENRVKSCHVCDRHGFFGPDTHDLWRPGIQTKNLLRSQLSSESFGEGCAPWMMTLWTPDPHLLCMTAQLIVIISNGFQFCKLALEIGHEGAE